MILGKFLGKPRIYRILLSFLWGCLLGLGIILLTIPIVVWRVKKKYENKVCPGVYFWGQPLGGKTIQELEDFFEEKEKEINQKKIVFLWKEGEEKQWEITPFSIDWRIDKEKNKEKILLNFEKKTELITDLLLLYRGLIFSQEIRGVFTFDEKKLSGIISQIRQEINRSSQDALFEFKNGRVINFRPSKEGLEVDEKQMRFLINLVFSQPTSDPTTVFDLPVKIIKPKITTEESNNLGIRELLAEGESFFKNSPPNRVHNIALAASRLHGIVISPGEIFSFNDKIGSISASTGYKSAYVIKQKQTILEDGGGVCQVSTTLFRAALRAGLPIIERKAHYYRVGYYEQGGYPPGLDATVYPPSPDLKFKNDTPGHILIQAITNKEEKRLVFQLYGVADGRKVEITKPVIHFQIPPPDPIYINEPNLPEGIVKQIDSAHWGAKVSFVRKVWDAKGDLKEEQIFWSNYVAWPAVYQRGVGPGG